MVPGMRWSVVLLGAGLLACGGQSRTQHAPPLAPATGTSGMGGMAAAGSGGIGGVTTAGGGGAAAGAAAAPSKPGTAGDGAIVPYAPEDTDASAACRSYEATDLASACRLVDTNCRADLESYYSLITSYQGFQDYFARQGCGVTEIHLDNRRSPATEVDFDSRGALMGYVAADDRDYGPCTTGRYERGQHLGDCPDVRECALAPKAATAEQVCLCACPDPPPADGMGRVDIACVDRPSREITCPPDAGSWDDLTLSGLTGFALTGCDRTLIEFTDEAGTLGCIYDGTGALAGERYESAGPTGCSGVVGWQGGLEYTSCDDEKRCVFGNTPSDATTPACTPLP